MAKFNPHAMTMGQDDIDSTTDAPPMSESSIIEIDTIAQPTKKDLHPLNNVRQRLHMMLWMQSMI